MGGHSQDDTHNGASFLLGACVGAFVVASLAALLALLAWRGRDWGSALDDDQAQGISSLASVADTQPIIAAAVILPRPSLLTPSTTSPRLLAAEESSHWDAVALPQTESFTVVPGEQSGPSSPDSVLTSPIRASTQVVWAAAPPPWADTSAAVAVDGEGFEERLLEV